MLKSNKLRLIAIILCTCTTILQVPSAYAQEQCSDVFNGGSGKEKALDRALTPSEKAAEGERAKDPEATRPQDLQAFGQAMTEGLLLRPDQADLFEVYRRIFFGNAFVDLQGATLHTVTDLLRSYPSLKKPSFREYDLTTQQTDYKTPESLTKLLKSQNMAAGQVRSNLFQIDANLGYWKRILEYRDLPLPENLSKLEKRQGQAQRSARFYRYLDRIVSPESRKLLRDEKVDYHVKIRTLFSVLMAVAKHMEKRGMDTKAIRQAMVDLVATSGFNNPSIQTLLQSRNSVDKVSGLRQVLAERDAIASELGYKEKFNELLQSLRIDSSSLTGRVVDEHKVLDRIEAEVLLSSPESTSSGVLRVRALSIQESPFRSCIGGSDCSSRTYFSKALDPNFIYFTLTDSEHRSSGHMTVVLGTSRDSNGADVRVAFVDKLQNLPQHLIPSFFEAVRLSLSEKGYTLSLPLNLGDHNGLSVEEGITNFVESEILAKLNSPVLSDFTPHSHQYKFENEFSRVDERLPVKAVVIGALPAGTEIRPGRIYEAKMADADLRDQMISDLVSLRNSRKDHTALKYIASGPTIAKLDRSGKFSIRKFMKDLHQIAVDKERSFEVRKQAYFEYLIGYRTERKSLPASKKFNFSASEKTQIWSEVQQWTKGSDVRRKEFATWVNKTWFEEARGATKFALKFLRLGLVKSGQRNSFGETDLIVATKSGNAKMIKVLLHDPKLNLLLEDKRGLTFYDHALALGRTDLIQYVHQMRPDLVPATMPVVKRVHEKMEFVRVQPGSFMMGKSQVPTSISKPFEFMSSPVTQKMFVQVMDRNPSKALTGGELSVLKIGNEFNRLNPDHPIENIGPSDAAKFVKRLNELSHDDAPILYEIIEGHSKGAEYDLVTEAQFEYVLTKAQTRSGETIEELFRRKDHETLKKHFPLLFSSRLTVQSTQPVKRAEPVMVDGQEVYDLLGNVAVWVRDNFDFTLKGGADPVYVTRGGTQVIRGAGWTETADKVDLLQRQYGLDSNRGGSIGIWLVRNK